MTVQDERSRVLEIITRWMLQGSITVETWFNGLDNLFKSVR